MIEPVRRSTTALKLGPGSHVREHREVNLSPSSFGYLVRPEKARMGRNDDADGCENTQGRNRPQTSSPYAGEPSLSFKVSLFVSLVLLALGPDVHLLPLGLNLSRPDCPMASTSKWPSNASSLIIPQERVRWGV